MALEDDLAKIEALRRERRVLNADAERIMARLDEMIREVEAITARVQAALGALPPPPSVH